MSDTLYFLAVWFSGFLTGAGGAAYANFRQYRKLEARIDAALNKGGDDE